MNWKKEFDKQFTSSKFPAHNLNYPGNVKDFISTEIIEKLIEDIPNHSPWSVVDELAKLKQQLRDKWL